jgi:hypothetical protein
MGGRVVIADRDSAAAKAQDVVAAGAARVAALAVADHQDWTTRSCVENVVARARDVAEKEDRVGVPYQVVRAVAAQEVVVAAPDAVPSTVLLSPAIRSCPSPPTMRSFPPPLASPLGEKLSPVTMSSPSPPTRWSLPSPAAAPPGLKTSPTSWSFGNLIEFFRCAR